MKRDRLNELLAELVDVPLNDYIVSYSFYHLLPVRETCLYLVLFMVSSYIVMKIPIWV